MDIHEAVKYRINDLCQERNWNINELIRRSGVNQSTVSELMTGRSKHPRISTLKRLSDGFGITLSDFFDDDIFEDVTIK